MGGIPPPKKNLKIVKLYPFLIPNLCILQYLPGISAHFLLTFSLIDLVDTFSGQSLYLRPFKILKF